MGLGDGLLDVPAFLEIEIIHLFPQRRYRILQLADFAAGIGDRALHVFLVLELQRFKFLAKGGDGVPQVAHLRLRLEERISVRRLPW